MSWVTIVQNPIWEYDDNPPDPGGAQTPLWQTSINGIRTNPRGEELYTNVRHKVLHAGRPSVPSEMNKTFWDETGFFRFETSTTGTQVQFVIDTTSDQIIDWGDDTRDNISAGTTTITHTY